MADVKTSAAKTVGGVVVLLIFAGLAVWGYVEFSTKYQELKISNDRIRRLLEKQTEQTLNYARELELYKENLAKTETLLTKVQEENNQLREKLVLLDKLQELEDTVARLKEKNTLMINHLSSLQKQEPDFRKSIQTMEEGRKVLSKYSKYIGDIKDRLSVIKRDEHRQEMARKKEDDRVKLLAGNNGYMIRDGQPKSMELVLPPKEKKDVTIDVTFVK